MALLRGEFTLRSGRKSNYYLDKYRFETQPDVLAALGKMLAERVTAETDRIAGAELGAVPLAAAAGMAANKPIVFIRNQKKDYGTAKQIEGVLNPGDNVLIVEDVLTTGGQVLEAVKTLQEMGAKIQRHRRRDRSARRRTGKHRTSRRARLKACSRQRILGIE